MVLACLAYVSPPVTAATGRRVTCYDGLERRSRIVSLDRHHRPGAQGSSTAGSALTAGVPWKVAPTPSRTTKADTLSQPRAMFRRAVRGRTGRHGCRGSRRNSSLAGDVAVPAVLLTSKSPARLARRVATRQLGPTWPQTTSTSWPRSWSPEAVPECSSGRTCGPRPSPQRCAIPAVS